MNEHRIVVNRVDAAVARLVATQAGHGVGARLALLALRLLGTDLQPRKVGDGLRLPHSTVGAVVHPNTEIGDDVTIWHGATIGRADVWLDGPGETRVSIGDEVILGANSVCLVRGGQHLHVGARAVIGAGAVVTQDVPAGEIWAGNPARKVGERPELQVTR